MSQRRCSQSSSSHSTSDEHLVTHIFAIDVFAVKLAQAAPSKVFDHGVLQASEAVTFGRRRQR